MINASIERYWMNLSWNNVLKIVVDYEWKKQSLLELPRHIKFLMEIKLCSMLQLDYINSNNRWDSNVSWLILIDDYFLDQNEDTIDSVLIEALSHQVIMTKQESWIKWLEISI